MGKIHQGQTAVDITRTIGVDITGNLDVKMKYIKPSLKEGEWTPTSIVLLTGAVTFSPTAVTDLDEYGWWTIWVKVTFADGSIAESEATQLFIYKAGQI